MPDLVRVPTPHTIAQSLENMVDMLKGDDIDKKTMARMLVAAASNVRMLFELEADPESGEFRLQNYGQAWMLADLLKSGDMVPSSYKTDEQVVIGLMKSMEIGVSPISGLANIMIINNRPSVWGDLAQALVARTGVWERHKVEEVGGPRPASDVSLANWPEDYGFRVSIWRKGNPEPFVGEYLVRDARRANLWGNTKKQPWITDPARMLFNRARAIPIRDGFADKLFGMGIIEEQMDFDVPQSRLGPAGAPRQLTSSLADDEPETETPTMPDYTEKGAPEAAGDAPATEGSDTPAEPAAAGDAPQAAAGDGETGQPPLI